MSRKKKRIKETPLEKINSINNSSVDNSYKEKNTVIDLSFPYLFDCVEYNQFSNKFRLPKDYIDYIHYLNSVIFKNISEHPCKEVFSHCDIFQKHTHILKNEQHEFVKNILIASFMEHGLIYESARRQISQNIDDVMLFQIGFDNDKGRVVGYFKENVFRPVLLDPHHLIYKTDIGKIRKFNDIKTHNFQPKDIGTFHIKQACICCGEKNESKLIDIDEDEVLKDTIYICEKCLIKILN